MSKMDEAKAIARYAINIIFAAFIVWSGYWAIRVLYLVAGKCG